MAVCVRTILGFSYRVIAEELNCSRTTILRDVDYLQKMKYIINMSDNRTSPRWKAGPNLPSTIIKIIREERVQILKCDSEENVTAASVPGESPQSQVHQGYIERTPSLHDILGGEYEPCFAHNTGYQFFITVPPKIRINEWNLTCPPENANGVHRWKLFIPLSRDPEDDRMFTILWTKKRQEKMTIWMPEEVLRGPSILEWNQLCKARLQKVVKWIESRYNCILMFEKRLGKPEFEFEETELSEEDVQLGRNKGEDEWFDKSRDILAYETNNPIKASMVSARALNRARIVEGQAQLASEIQEMKEIILALAEGQILQSEHLGTISNVLTGLLKTEPNEQSESSETDPGVMFG